MNVLYLLSYKLRMKIVTALVKDKEMVMINTNINHLETSRYPFIEVPNGHSLLLKGNIQVVKELNCSSITSSHVI